MRPVGLAISGSAKASTCVHWGFGQMTCAMLCFLLTAPQAGHSLEAYGDTC